MKIKDLEKVVELNTYIKGIEDFIDICNNKSEHISIHCGIFRATIAEGQEDEIINALGKIRSNTIEQLKELGVEVDC